MKNTHFFTRMRIISGGQTGIDRAVLDFCLSHGIECGGWCPQGRLAEDGPIDRKYPLTEITGGGYPERTMANVVNSDATVIIYYKEKSGGTFLSWEYVLEAKKPFLLLDLAELSSKEAAERLKEFIQLFDVAVLNFSGPRASEWAEGYEICRKVLCELIS
jgi:hypothetical protein